MNVNSSQPTDEGMIVTDEPAQQEVNFPASSVPLAPSATLTDVSASEEGIQPEPMNIDISLPENETVNPFFR